jgi:hypothetical protein
MQGGGWGVGGLFAGAAVLGEGRPDELRVRALVLVDEAGNEVGRLAATPRGAELVLGGEAQASLVTDGTVAALNLVGDEVIVRTDPADDD